MGCRISYPAELKSSNRSPVWVISTAVPFPIPAAAAASQMDGTQVLVVKSETEGRAGSTPGQLAHSRECQLGCVFTQTDVDDQGRPVRDEGSTTDVGVSRPRKSLGSALIPRPTIEAGTGPGSELSWVMARTGSGILPISIATSRCKITHFD